MIQSLQALMGNPLFWKAFVGAVVAVAVVAVLVARDRRARRRHTPAGIHYHSLTGYSVGSGGSRGKWL